MSRLHLRCGSLAAVSLVCALEGCSADVPHETLARSESGLNANDKVAFDYFLAKGLTSFQAAGIVGNLDQESGMSPTAVQPGGPGRGIAQWSVGGRWDTDANDNATAYASGQGQSVLSLSLQLDFIWYELTNFSNYGLAPLRQSTDVTTATVVFEKDFEGCGNCQEATRIAYAKAALTAFGSDSVDGGPPAEDAGVPCDVPGVGAGQCMPTSACAALPNHVSTPGYCPGPADIECCTGPAGDADSGAADGGPSRSDGGAGGPPRADGDASVPDASKGVYAGSVSVTADSGATTGCAVASDRLGATRSGGWLCGGVLLVVLGRRRRHKAADRRQLEAFRVEPHRNSIARVSSARARRA